ncbi:glycosyltransferase family 4 protein [candidate division WOR-3 bacterium]|nr:glycosyltransferase family 4 protein [candidate division WOR-3 bacterium]
MRILVLNWRCTKNPLAGGAEIYFQEVFSRLVSRGHQVTLLSERFPGAQTEEMIEGIKVMRAGGRLTFNFTAGRLVGHLAESLNADVVIDDLNKIPFYSPWHTKRPVLAILMHLFRGSIFHEALPPLAAYVWLAETMIPLAYKQCRFAVLSESSRSDTARVGIAPDRIAVIPPGTDFDRFSPGASTPREPVVLHVGRLKRYKATGHLLQAARLLKDRGRRFMTVIVGDGDDRPRLEALAAKLGLGGDVRFTGFIPEAEKVNWYRRAAVLSENSIKEGWGLIVMEANACGTPVVVADSPGLRDSSKDGVNGLVYKYGDVAALAERLERLLSDEVLRNRLGEQAIAWAKQWTWDGAAEAMERSIEQTINEGQ